MFQWTGSRVTPDVQAVLGYGASPARQASQAMYEIASNPQYASVYAAMNNPNASLAQIESALINRYEAPANPSGDLARSAYANALYNHAAYGVK